MRYFIGDVRDAKPAYHAAMRGVDYVVHAAALKQVQPLNTTHGVY